MRRPDLTTRIFIGLLLGIVAGYVWPAFGVAIKPIADAFLRMIKMIIAPLLFATLVIGIAGTSDLKSMGRIGLKAIVYFEAATTITLTGSFPSINVPLTINGRNSAGQRVEINGNGFGSGSTIFARSVIAMPRMPQILSRRSSVNVCFANTRLMLASLIASRRAISA